MSTWVSGHKSRGSQTRGGGGLLPSDLAGAEADGCCHKIPSKELKQDPSLLGPVSPSCLGLPRPNSHFEPPFPLLPSFPGISGPVSHPQKVWSFTKLSHLPYFCDLHSILGRHVGDGLVPHFTGRVTEAVRVSSANKQPLRPEPCRVPPSPLLHSQLPTGWVTPRLLS